MKFQFLVRAASWKDIEKILIKYYPQAEQSAGKYRDVFYGLKVMVPRHSEMRLAVCECRSEEGISFDVSGLDGTLCRELDGFDVSRYPEDANKEAGFGISSIKWEEWLSMEVESDTLNRLNAQEIVAHCLWEMTFYGVQ